VTAEARPDVAIIGGGMIANTVAGWLCRIPAFERPGLRRSRVGHSAWTTLDRNALLGPGPGCPDLLAANGLSGHGLQQAPAVGRGIAEFIVHAPRTGRHLIPETAP
jgi:glycine/D-amino acid oxidase-like deaminating enzyme